MDGAPTRTDQEVVEAALVLPEDAQSGYVDAACEGDAAQAIRVNHLLARHREDERNIEEQLARLKPAEAGDRIGPYKLLQQIGEGGFGTVWMADQEKPIRRRVALKVIKIGMDTKEVIARFEQERRARTRKRRPLAPYPSCLPSATRSLPGAVP